MRACPPRWTLPAASGYIASMNSPASEPSDPLAESLPAPLPAPAGVGESPPEAAADSLDAPAGDFALTADSMPLVQVIEAILFSSDAPLSPGKLAQIVGLDSTRPIRQTIETLNKSYEERQAAYRIEDRAGGYLLLTLPQYAQYIERLAKKKDEGRLTPAALETLAIVGYKQPITRAAVEAIRGVACGEVLRTLMEHNLVKIVGRAEEIGRPMLYGTTRYFLEVFGLANLKDLPKADALREPK